MTLASVLLALSVFVPPTHADGTRTVLPLTFPDGTRAALSYPPRLALAELGVVPSSSASLGPDGRDLLVAHAGRHAFATALDGGTPPRRRATFRGAHGTRVPFYDLSRGPHYLAFQFGGWAVLVWDRPGGGASLTRARRARWARHLTGRETATGFLRLRGTGRLRLARRDEHAGPRLELGRLDARWISLAIERCRLRDDEVRIVSGRRVSWQPGSGFASWCLSRSVSIQARGRARQLRAAIRGIALRGLSSRP